MVATREAAERPLARPSARHPPATRKGTTLRTSKKLGQLLLELGWISERDLVRALQSQEVLGGRLGTCLLEVDALSESLLQKALAMQLGVAAARPLDLQNVPEEIYSKIPARLAIRCQAIPFRMLGNDLWVALLDVHNLGYLDEIEFASECRIRPRVANELRMEIALERFYRHPTTARFKQLWTRLHEEDPTALILDPRPPSETVPALSPNPSDSIESELDDTDQMPAIRQTAEMPEPGIRMATAEEVAALNTSLQPPLIITRPVRVISPEEASTEVTPPEADASLEDLLGRLRECVTRDEVGHEAIDYLSERFLRTALLAVHQKQVKGWLGAGVNFDAARLVDLAIEFDEASVFLNLRSSGEFFAGALAPMVAHERLMNCWHAPLPTECLVIPVRIKDRLVALLFGDRGPEGLDPHDIEDCLFVARQIERALCQVIMRGKRAS